MLLSTYCDPPLSWTSQWQQLQEVYVSGCAALQLKPNTRAIKYFYGLAKEHKRPDTVLSVDASPFFLGRRGALPLLGVVRLCTSLESLNLSESGIDDIACGSICASLSEHPNLCTVDLRGNNLTGASLDSLHRLGNSWATRDSENNRQKKISILISEGYGLNKASCASLQSWKATRLERHWGFAACTRPRVSLLEKRRRYVTSKHDPGFSADLRLMKYRLGITSHLSSQVPKKTAQLSTDRWLILSVFISCAYTEFFDETNLIHRIIFPRANWKLRPYRIHLVPVMLHSTLEEYFQPAATVQADGKEPIDYTRLPTYRKGRRGFEEDRCGRRHGLLYNEEGAHSSEVRALMIKNCDAFVGIYSDMFDRSISQHDLSIARSQSLPIMSFRKKISGLPVEFTQLHDYKKNLEFSHASMNSNLGGRSFGVRNESVIREEIEKDMVAFDDFMSQVKRMSGPAFVEYEAPYSRAYLGGERRFDIDEDFVKLFIVNLVCLGHHYLDRREGGSSPAGSVFDPTPSETLTSRNLPSIPCQNWGAEPTFPTFTKSVVPLVVAPFRSEDEILRQKHGIDTDSNYQQVPCVTEDIERPFCAIVGDSGTGKTTQLRAIAAAIAQDSLATVVKHSVIHGKASLVCIMTGLLQQLYRKYTENGSSVFEDFVRPDASEQDLVAAFCSALKAAPMLSEYSNRICFFIDDDDFSEGSFVKLFLTNPVYFERLQSALPAECRAQFYFSCKSFDSGGVPEDLLKIQPVPLFSETEAADLFFYFTVGGIGTHHNFALKVKEAARRIAFTKRHGTRPLYVYLAAREVAYYLETTPIGSIVEVLPETVEQLAETAMKVALPPDLECFFEALATAPEPFPGAMLRFAMNNYRQYPHFTEKTSERYRWSSPRTWGRITEPLPSSAGTIAVCDANFSHLFEHCLRLGGFLTSRWHSTKHNVWRTPWRFAHRTVLEAARRIFNPACRLNDPTSAISRQVWDRPLKRLAYVRENPFVVRALSNITDVTFFFQVPQRLFTLLDNKGYDELVLLMRDMHSMPKTLAEQDILLSFSEFCQRYWRALKRHRAFYFVQPAKGPTAVADRLLAAFKRHSCAGFDEISCMEIDVRSNTKLCMKSSVCSSCCALYVTHCAKPHELSLEMVTQSNANPELGKITLVDTSDLAASVYQAHQTAVCSVEVYVRAEVIHVASMALLDPRIVLAVKRNSVISVVGSIALDLTPRVPIQMCLSIYDSAALEGGHLVESFPSLAFADKNALCVTGAKSAEKTRQLLKFDGHDSPIVICGFSPGGCKVFSIDSGGSCIVWGAPETPLSGSIIAVTTFSPVPRNARFIDSTTMLYSYPGGVFSWNSETSHVTNLSSDVSQGEVLDRFEITFDQKQVPGQLVCFDVKDTMVKWCDRQPPDSRFVLSEHMLVQRHVSTSDAVGNREIAEWRWKFSDRFAVGFDTAENMFKAFCRKTRRQIPLFYAVIPSDLGGAKDDPLRKGSVSDSVFAPFSEFCFVGSNNIVAINDQGSARILRIMEGPMVYPTNPIVIDM